jgi:hypothetical protein
LATKRVRTVRAFESDIAFINEHARRQSCSPAEVIHTLCCKLRKEIYLQELGESFDLARARAQQSAQLAAEQGAWDCTLSDGLVDS